MMMIENKQLPRDYLDVRLLEKLRYGRSFFMDNQAEF
jgi:hypothetical protein